MNARVAHAVLGITLLLNFGKKIDITSLFTCGDFEKHIPKNLVELKVSLCKILLSTDIIRIFHIFWHTVLSMVKLEIIQTCLLALWAQGGIQGG